MIAQKLAIEVLNAALAKGGGHGDGLSKGRRLVCYLYKRELCGKEFILSADEVAKHLYSVGAHQNQERRRTSPRLMRRSKPF